MPNNSNAKYICHYNRQVELILSAAEHIFIQKGIEKVSFSDIAAASHIMRSTLYKYFKSKEQILWEIYHRKIKELESGLIARYQQTNQTTLDRIESYFDYFLTIFQNDSSHFLFQNLFEQIYSDATTKYGATAYTRTFNPGEFGSTSSVAFLSQNFHDGSVRTDLDPHITSVCIVYSTIGILVELSKNTNSIPVKYQINTIDAAKHVFQLFSDSLKNPQN